MKKIFIAIAALLMVISACQKEPSLTVTTPAEIPVSADSGSSSISFTTNQAWTASSTAPWVHLSATSGESGSVTITLECDPNDTYEDRTATVTINAGGLTQTVVVKQPQNYGVVIPQQEYKIDADTEALELEVQANTNFKVTVDVDWIKIVKISSKALEKGMVVLELQKNGSYQSREGAVTITPDSGAKKVITVNQSGMDKPLAVDLGLSVKWASCNVGSDRPEGTGGYYAWGEVETKEVYEWSTYKYGSLGSKLTKYCTDPAWGTVDGLTVLESQDDVAATLLKDGWRMPTSGEFQELIDNCEWQETTVNDIFGYQVIGPNGNTIFIPAGGSFNGTDGYANTVFGNYWAANIATDSRCRPYYFYFSKDLGYALYSNGFRPNGVTVRPVKP